MRSHARLRTVFARVILLCLAIGITVPTHASETISYSYDALGRLVQVSHSGTVNNGASSCYSYDPADNRTNVTSSTSSSCTPPTCTGVSFTIASNGAVTEGANSVFTITKTGTASGSCSVNYASAGGTATAGSDYTTASGSLTFTSSQTSQTVSVATIDDTTVESAETFTMALSSPTGGSMLGSPSSATGTINDNDGGGSCSAVSYVISDASTVEGGTLTFTVTKSGATSASCGVNYATANGTAVAGTHYTATSGTLTFSAAQTTATVSVTTFNLCRLRGTKTMYVNLSGATGGATITDSQGIGSILNSCG